MSKDFNTLLALGAKAPFILVMNLPKAERAEFIKRTTPAISQPLKSQVLNS